MCRESALAAESITVVWGKPLKNYHLLNDRTSMNKTANQLPND